MGYWPRAYDPSNPKTRFERDEIVRKGFEELLPSYRNSLSAVRRGKRVTDEEDQKSLLSSCDRDLSATIKVIEIRAREAFYGDVQSLTRSVRDLLSERDLQILRMVRHQSIREVADTLGLNHKSVIEVLQRAAQKVARARSRQKTPLLWFLSARQAEVLELCDSGLEASDIAETLSLTIAEVERDTEIIRCMRAAMAKVVTNDIQDILSMLSTDQRQIYILEAGGYPSREICRLMGKSAATVKTQRARIRDKVNKIPPI